ncbi:periplasmic binding protein-like II [Anaeromyces robustus]|uniref:Periplasmic binding protein-like II n=1 Tax=Anaeromyces robustus TaxID=1754192 RepID=A0A1Y1WYD9_9FUNG|nr:periplasmic binding protein-like II [Anaeromyces robustus]|eukprot:ORX78587.1 periplasmic binding protein-like II [Anaeromyces robustus]
MIFKNTLIFLILLGTVYGVTINLSAFSYGPEDPYYEAITNDFNEYAKEKNLNITLTRMVLSSQNTSVVTNNYASTVESWLKKRNTEYDIFTMNTIYTSRFAKHSADLKKYISKNVIDSYSKGVASKIGYYNDKLVGLPLYIDIGMLYSNKRLLNKYNQTIPKTWDELISSAKYIMEKEYQNENYDIIGYIANMSDGETSICSSLEFIYSFRDSIESEMPEYRSEEALRAFKKIIEIKNKISSDSSFLISSSKVGSTCKSDNVIFAKVWYGNNTKYYSSQIPGEKEGISASCVGGRNLIINNYISEEKKIASGKVIEYILSKKIQIKYLLEHKMLSGLEDVYYDEEYCSLRDCEPFRNLQFISRPSPYFISYDEYSVKYRTILKNFLYKNGTAEEALKKLDYMFSIYDIENNSTFGKVIVSMTSLVIFIFFSTYFLTFSKKFKNYINKFDSIFWASILLGLCVYLSQNYFVIGELTEYKCKARIISILFGITLFYTPILIYEIINFPENNKYSEYVQKKKNLILSSFIIVDLFLMLLIFLLSTYQIDTKVIENGMNYKTCSLIKDIHISYIIISALIKFIIILATILLTFLEWNVNIVRMDIHNISYVLYSNTIALFIYIVLLLIKNKTIYLYYSNIIFYSFLSTLISYLIIIWLRAYQEYQYISNKDDIKIKKRNNSVQKTNNSLKKSGVLSKMIDYHYSQGSSSKLVIDNDKNSQFSTQPEIILDTSLMKSGNLTDIYG